MVSLLRWANNCEIVVNKNIMNKIFNKMLIANIQWHYTAINLPMINLIGFLVSLESGRTAEFEFQKNFHVYENKSVIFKNLKNSPVFAPNTL